MQFAKYKDNLKQTWKLIGSLVKRKTKGILFKLRHYVPISTLKQLYYTLIYPYLMYGLMSWGTAYQTKLNKIKVSQNNIT